MNVRRSFEGPLPSLLCHQLIILDSLECKTHHDCHASSLQSYKDVHAPSQQLHAGPFAQRNRVTLLKEGLKFSKVEVKPPQRRRHVSILAQSVHVRGSVCS